MGKCIRFEEVMNEFRSAYRSEHVISHSSFAFYLWPLISKPQIEQRGRCRQFWTAAQRQHVDTLYISIWYCLCFNLALTFGPLTMIRHRFGYCRLFDVCPIATLWHSYLCFLSLFEIWPYFNPCDPKWTWIKVLKRNFRRGSLILSHTFHTLSMRSPAVIVHATRKGGNINLVSV